MTCSAVWTVGKGTGMICCFPFVCWFLPIFPSLSSPLCASPSPVLFDYFPFCHVAVYVLWERPAYTEDCLSEPWMDKVHSVKHSLWHSRQRGGVTLSPSHSMTHNNTNSSLRAVLHRSLLPFKGVCAPFQMHPRDHHTLSVHTKSPGGLACGRGVW